MATVPHSFWGSNPERDGAGPFLVLPSGAVRIRRDIFSVNIPTSGMKNAGRTMLVCHFPRSSQPGFFSADYNVVHRISFCFFLRNSYVVSAPPAL
jgi:hypothetical protein